MNVQFIITSTHVQVGTYPTFGEEVSSKNIHFKMKKYLFYSFSPLIQHFWQCNKIYVLYQAKMEFYMPQKATFTYMSQC